MSVKGVGSLYVPRLSASDQLLGCIQRRCAGEDVLKVAKESNSVRSWIPVAGMRPDVVPSSTFVNVTVVSNQKIVPDIVPFSGIHMVVLNILDRCLALVQRVAS
jgi:hypothetical protein